MCSIAIHSDMQVQISIVTMVTKEEVASLGGVCETHTT